MEKLSRKRTAAAAAGTKHSTKRIKPDSEEKSDTLARKDSIADVKEHSGGARHASTFRPPSAPLAIRRKAAKAIGTSGKTARTLNNTIKRQWDPKKDDLGYGFLLDQRCKEQLSNVDRYVPSMATKKQRSFFPLRQLPDQVLAGIFGYLLVNKEPIVIDFYWLRPFVNGHAQVPVVMQSVEVAGQTYTLPIGWNQLLTDVQTMKDGMDQFKKALEMREAKTRAKRSPCRGLSIALLKVSRKVYKVAAEVFYSQNTFKFPCATSAWIQLDSFLITIGPHNAKKIQHLEIHAPMWHRLIQEDFVEGALIDSLSPATRFGVLRPPARDRVLSAIENAVRLLSPGLKTMAVELANTAEADKWTGRYVNDKRMIAACDAEEHANRKAKGLELLKQLSARFPEKEKPTLTICNVPRTKGGKKEFHKQILSVKAEAAKYGWFLASR